MTKNMFEQKNIQPMLMYETTPFDNDEYIFELKLDGIRCIAYLDQNSVVLRNKRNKDVTDIYPELKQMCQAVKKPCILDGELICLDSQGKPDFYTLQKRSLMTDKFKISILSQSKRVYFVAYDILFCGDKQLIDLPLMTRKSILESNVAETTCLSVSRYILNKGVDFFELAKKNQLEGIVAKKKDGRYYLGKRTREWLKIKVMLEEDLIVCGYQPTQNNGIKTLIMGGYNNGKLITRGNVSLGISAADKHTIIDYAKTNQVDNPWFNNKKNVVWLNLKLVARVRFMTKTVKGNMRQPVFVGLRDDKIANDCIINDI